VRNRLQFAAAALLVALGASMVIPADGTITPAPASGFGRGFASADESGGETLTAAVQAPVWSVGQVSQTGGENPLAVDSLTSISPAGLSLEETREQVGRTAVALRVGMLQKEADDRTLADVRSAVAELRDETRQIAATTVETAIATYRHNEIDQNLLELDDLNRGLRANALGDAAIVSDTESFDRYRDKIKDLELAELNLGAEIAENELLTEQVRALRDRLEVEQTWLVDFEERTIQNNARYDSATESIWAQSLGTKQGFYLRTCPVAGTHSFIDSWGFARSGGRRHKGVDLIADIGVPIVAPANGTVSYRWNRVGGRSFHLTDEFGNYYYGTHLSAYGDSDGEVRAGQVIGYVGDDGNAAGIPHLHFEIHPGGRGNPINPFPDTAAVCDGVQY
jgi:murein DD-endopeptidase MepM/ murein hydrolase activator NlpD